MNKQDIDRVEFFHDEKPNPYRGNGTSHDLRWRYIAAGNSTIMAGPEEGYGHLGDMIADVERVTLRRITHDIEFAAAHPATVIFWSWADEQPMRYVTGTVPEGPVSDFSRGGIISIPTSEQQGMG
jgi:hypothetical protein